MKIMFALALLLSTTIAHAQQGCFEFQGHKCAAKPGIAEGQMWTLDATITLPNANVQPGGGWIQFVDGRGVSSTPQTGSYCAINTTDGKRPNELIRGDVAILPATKSPLAVTGISWYVGTVHFEGKTASGNTFGLVVYCAEDEGRKETTSLQAIQKHLDGILTLKK